MKLRFFALCCAVFLTLPNAALSDDFSGVENLYARLLLSEADVDVRLAGRFFYRAASQNPELNDLMAEVAWDACLGARSLDPDALSWLGKALGSTRQARYAAVFDFCADKAPAGSTKRYMREARENLEGATDNPFEGRNTNLAETRARLAKQTVLVPRDQLAAKFEGLRAGLALEQVYSMLGSPDQIALTDSPNQAAFSAGVDRLKLEYSKLGTIRFVLPSGQTQWRIVDAESARGLFWSTIDRRLVVIGDQVDNSDSWGLVEIVDYLLKQDKVERDVLDHVATRLYKSRMENEQRMVVGTARLCKILGRFGDTRYRPLLLDVSNTAADKMVRKYALNAVSDLAESSGPPFVPPSR